MRIWHWIVYQINLRLGNLFWPGLDSKQEGDWRWRAAMSFWSRSYWHGQCLDDPGLAKRATAEKGKQE